MKERRDKRFFHRLMFKGLLFSGILPGAMALTAQNPYLEEYIREGLRSNQALKQKELDYAVQLSALKEARGLFFPDLSLNARYTVADGGRIIEFPVGDLLNPVYSTLNLLTASSQFPQIENESFPFYRKKEQETKLTLVQPIFQADLIQNYQIRKQYGEIARIDVDLYRKELIREISKAYYAYQKAYQMVDLADSALRLVGENLRVSQRLFENDLVTRDAVYRSESELSQVEVQQAQAGKALQASRAYFNFLLNRSLDSRIKLMDEAALPPQHSLDEATQMALSKRYELQQINQYRQLNRHVTKLHRGSRYPGIFGVVDYGIQGEDYSFTRDDDFLLASLVMQWTLFQGSANRSKVQQSRIEGEKLSELYSETQQKVRLEVINHYYGLQAAYEAVQSAAKQKRSAQKAYELIRRKYSQGMTSLLELIDARTTLTSASANSIMARSEYFSILADFNYATGWQRFEDLQIQSLDETE